MVMCTACKIKQQYMKTLLFIPFLTLTMYSFGQTDIIELRSRNASLKSYKKSTELTRYDHVASNFGMAPEPLVKTAVLDSIKALTDSTAVVYTSEYCARGYRLEYEPIFVDSFGRELNEPKRVYGNPRRGQFWQPGADTVVNHPIFTKRHSLDSVKDVIDRDYNFNLPSDSITFIGFDNGMPIQNEDSVKPVKHKRQKKNGFGWELLFMILSPIVFLLGMNTLKLIKVADKP